MSQVPAAYTPQTSFADEAMQPIARVGLPGAKLDAEFSRAADSLNDTIARLSEIQRDDGALQNGVVGLASLAPDTLALLIALGVTPKTWRAGTAFKKGDLVANPKTRIALTTTGSLTCDGSAFVPPVLTEVDTDPLNGKPRYNVGGEVLNAGNFGCEWSGTQWEAFVTGLGKWRSNADVATPNLIPPGAYHVTTNPNGWSNSNTTGAPVMALAGGVTTPGTYLCITDHTASADFADDLAKWATVAAKPEAGNLTVDAFTGNGAQTAFVLSVIPLEEVNTQVFVNGLYQPKSAYSLIEQTVTFAVAPADAAVIEVVSGIPSQSIIRTVSDFSISTDKLQAFSVTEPKLADGSVSARTLQADAVAEVNIADNAVTAGKIAAGAIIAEKIGAGAVDSGQLAANAVTTEKISNNAVTTDKIAGGSVTSAKIAAGQLALNGPTPASTNPTLAKHVVTKEYLERASAVSSAMIADAAVVTAKIADAAITGAKMSKSGNLPCQIRTMTKDGIESLAGTGSSWTDIPGMEIVINRINNSGKMRVQAAFGCASSSANPVAFRIHRTGSGGAGTPIGVPSLGTSRSEATASGGANTPALGVASVVVDFTDGLDGVGANQLTYKVQWRIASGSTAYLNRSSSDTNDATGIRTISSLTLTELAA